MSHSKVYRSEKHVTKDPKTKFQNATAMLNEYGSVSSFDSMNQSYSKQNYPSMRSMGLPDKTDGPSEKTSGLAKQQSFDGNFSPKSNDNANYVEMEKEKAIRSKYNRLLKNGEDPDIDVIYEEYDESQKSTLNGSLKDMSTYSVSGRIMTTHMSKFGAEGQKSTRGEDYTDCGDGKGQKASKYDSIGRRG